MQDKDKPGEDVTEVGKPMSHEVLMGPSYLDTIKVEKSIAIAIEKTGVSKIKSGESFIVQIDCVKTLLEKALLGSLKMPRTCSNLFDWSIRYEVCEVRSIRKFVDRRVKRIIISVGS